MILGLDPVTFFFVFGSPMVGVVLAVLFGLNYRVDSEDWWVIDELFRR